MSDEERKKKELGNEEMFDKNRTAAAGSSHRKVSPLGMRVLVQIRADDSTTDTGLYLPEGAKAEQDESLFAEVIEVAKGFDEDIDDEANISGIPEGALVLIPKDAGVRVPWDDNLRLVETSEILALVHEVSLV